MRCAVLVLAALAVRGTFAAPELLAPPRFADPTRMCAYSCSNTMDVATAYFADDRATNFTAICWMKWTPRSNFPAGSLVVPFVDALVSADPARATTEGGDELPDLQSHRYELPLALDNATWGETCLTDYQCPSSLSNGWRYGCYCVNVETDTALTLNVGGTERSIAASAEKQIFNIQATSASRAVSIAAASASATVKFGIAENPLVQFCGAHFDDILGGTSSQFNGGVYGGIASNEWRMVVVRGAIAANAVTLSICGYNASSKFSNEETKQTSLWRPRSTFARGARLRLLLAEPVGTSGDGQYDVFTLYGFRVYRGWFDDAAVERMRDLDAAELARRGM